MWKKLEWRQEIAAIKEILALQSVLSGGEFANGAKTGAFSYLFNYCSNRVGTSKLEQRMFDWRPCYKAFTLSYSHTLGDGSWTSWEVVDALSVGAGAFSKGLSVSVAVFKTETSGFVTVTSWAEEGIVADLNAGRWK